MWWPADRPCAIGRAGTTATATRLRLRAPADRRRMSRARRPTIRDLRYLRTTRARLLRPRVRKSLRPNALTSTPAFQPPACLLWSLCQGEAAPVREPVFSRSRELRRGSLRRWRGEGWRSRQGSNLQPSGSKPDALSVALRDRQVSGIRNQVSEEARPRRF